MSKTIFVTGISTDVGKTVAAAVLTEALTADYWKPVQAGELHDTDTDKVRKWVNNRKSFFHPSAYELKTPMSPHAAAQLEQIEINFADIGRPSTSNTLIIEGAGGLLVPLNSSELVIDLIDPADEVVVVSKHYLGSINHTLLSLEALRRRNLKILGIIFNGAEHPSTESIIAKLGQVNILGRIDEEPYIDNYVISEYADALRPEILKKVQ